MVAQRVSYGTFHAISAGNQTIKLYEGGSHQAASGRYCYTIWYMGILKMFCLYAWQDFRLLVSSSCSELSDKDNQRVQSSSEAYEDMFALIRLLVEHGVDVNTSDKWGYTALDILSHGNEHQGFITYLIDKRADYCLWGYECNAKY